MSSMDINGSLMGWSSWLVSEGDCRVLNNYKLQAQVASAPEETFARVCVPMHVHDLVSESQAKIKITCSISCRTTGRHTKHRCQKIWMTSRSWPKVFQVPKSDGCITLATQHRSFNGFGNLIVTLSTPSWNGSSQSAQGTNLKRITASLMQLTVK